MQDTVSQNPRDIGEIIHCAIAAESMLWRIRMDLIALHGIRPHCREHLERLLEETIVDARKALETLAELS